MKVAGNASYHPASGFTPPRSGSYWWYSSYAGDGSSATASSTCGIGMAAQAPASIASRSTPPRRRPTGLTSADIGHRITVVVTAADADRQQSHAAAKPVGPVKR